MKKNYFILVLALVAFAFQSCENDDNVHSGNQQVEKSFAEKYPGATRIDWQKKGDYLVVDFFKGNELEAWFDQNGSWYMTETDLLSINALPDAVKNAFLISDYQTWHVEDIDMLERKDMETVYVLEVEKGNQEYDLYYSPNGVLIKIVADVNNRDDNEHYLPSTMNNDIKSYITSHYPQAKILEMEVERGMIEVDIIDGKIHRELLFKSAGEWVHTKTQIRKSDTPVIVLNALKASAYSSYNIDDIYFYETPQRNYYYFELESRSEVELIITNEGIIEVVRISKD